MMTLYVGNLSFSTTEDEIRSAFEVHGEVASVRLALDRGRSRGFAFVEMADTDQAKQAIAALNGANLNGRAILVDEARPRPERPPQGRAKPARSVEVTSMRRFQHHGEEWEATPGGGGHGDAGVGPENVSVRFHCVNNDDEPDRFGEVRRALDATTDDDLRTSVDDQDIIRRLTQSVDGQIPSFKSEEGAEDYGRQIITEICQCTDEQASGRLESLLGRALIDLRLSPPGGELAATERIPEAEFRWFSS